MMGVRTLEADTEDRQVELNRGEDAIGISFQPNGSVRFCSNHGYLFSTKKSVVLCFACCCSRKFFNA